MFTNSDSINDSHNWSLKIVIFISARFAEDERYSFYRKKFNHVGAWYTPDCEWSISFVRAELNLVPAANFIKCKHRKQCCSVAWRQTVFVYDLKKNWSMSKRRTNSNLVFVPVTAIFIVNQPIQYVHQLRDNFIVRDATLTPRRWRQPMGIPTSYLILLDDLWSSGWTHER